MVSAENIIECPQLEFLELEWLYNSNSWRSGSCVIPDFGKDIRPTVVTIHLWSNGPSFRDLFAWIKCCIDRLPFPNLIEVLKIHIKKYTGIRDDPLPTILDYETLSRVLQPLCKDGVLRTIAWEVSMDGNHFLNVKPDSARESAKLKAGLAALSPANISDLQFIMDRTQFSTWMSRRAITAAAYIDTHMANSVQ
ncbi:hypothetical protein EYR38_005016 [Pleurotus pulmonarius]|nr:hypothetical protein EYR38_005016 [Pleurotus pulmonarius]